MKTTSQKKQVGLESRSAQLSSKAPAPEAAQSAVAPVERKDSRLPIDTEARKKNRTLPTAKVLQMLQTAAPEAFRLAEVVGKWVWVTFQEQPAAELRQQLAQLGFHWNNTRQTWQHPCGTLIEERADYDPRKRYGSYFAAQQQPV